jgi:hypothetical protein
MAQVAVSLTLAAMAWISFKRLNICMDWLQAFLRRDMEVGQ